MKRYIFLLIGLALFTTACNKDYSEGFGFEEDFQEDDFDQEIDNNNDSSEGELTLYNIVGDDIEKIKDYNVPSNLKPFQDDVENHQALWDLVIKLFSYSDRRKIKQFEVFHGGGDLLGYVAPLDEDDLSAWRFAIAVDITHNVAAAQLQDLLTMVTIHEYGHVLTLNDDQVKVDFSGCPTYHTGEGCSTNDSYINKLFNIGWTDIINQHNENNPFATYDQYSDRFVSDYAATNPGEDVAETFTYFVVEDSQPSGNSIRDQKIKMMYQESELVRLRDHIRSQYNVSARPSGNFWDNYRSFRKNHKCTRLSCSH